MERYKRGKRKLLASHAKSWLWGRHAVLEILRAGRWPVVELHLDEGLDAEALASTRTLAERAGAPLEIVPAKRLRELCHTSEHQGYLARMGPFPYANVEQVLGNRSKCPLYAILDGVQDPHNFGSVVRSAEVFGIDAVFIGESEQVGVTTLAARSSVGAVGRVAITRAASLQALARAMKGLGICVVGASEDAERKVTEHDFKRPSAIVLGNEGTGIRQDLRRECDAMVAIPQLGEIGSLNVAAAAAILFYEARRQRATSPHTH
ncbi:MAG: 23S rRNA (guanosine(2251)-2'-O)-methyltransferase RlmB [Planctomycetota bacterium]